MAPKLFRLIFIGLAWLAHWSFGPDKLLGSEMPDDVVLVDTGNMWEYIGVLVGYSPHAPLSFTLTNFDLMFLW